jgi:hypothetical protein
VRKVCLKIYALCHDLKQMEPNKLINYNHNMTLKNIHNIATIKALFIALFVKYGKLVVLTLYLVQIGILYNCLFPRKLHISEEGLTICNFNPRKDGPFFGLWQRVNVLKLFMKTRRIMSIKDLFLEFVLMTFCVN